MFLISLIYASKVTEELNKEGVGIIVEKAREHNKKLNITGILCFDNSYFLQCIEGSRSIVNELYAKIVNDPRHSDTLLLGYSEIETRSFANWDMGLALPTKSKRPLFLKHSVNSEFNPFEMSGKSAKRLLIDLANSNNVI